MDLAAERKKRKLTQKQLSERSAISCEVIADIERGKTRGAPSTLARLEQTLAEADRWVAVSPLTGVPYARLGAQVTSQRRAEGLTVAALAKLMGRRKADVEALENGDPAFLEDAWAALERFKAGQQGDVQVLGGGICGWCGKQHEGLKCP